MAVKLGDAFVALGTKDELDKGLNAARVKVNGWISNIAQGIAQGVGQAVAGAIGNGVRAAISEIREGITAASVVKHRGWAKTTKFAAELEYTHFGDDHPELAHELQTFKFYPVPIGSVAEKRKQTIKDVVLEVLAGGEMNQKALIDAVKAKVDAGMGIPVGAQKIRDEIIALAAASEIKAGQEASNKPIFYSLYSDYRPLLDDQ